VCFYCLNLLRFDCSGLAFCFVCVGLFGFIGLLFGCYLMVGYLVGGCLCSACCFGCCFVFMLDVG